jgi:hypothetical protein
MSPALHNVPNTTPVSQEIAWLSLTLDDGPDEDDEYSDEPEDGSVAEFDLNAESQLQIDGGEVRFFYFSSRFMC